MHVIGLMELLGKYEGRELRILEGSTDGTKYATIEGLLIGFLDGLLDMAP